MKRLDEKSANTLAVMAIALHEMADIDYKVKRTKDRHHKCRDETWPCNHIGACTHSAKCEKEATD